MVRFHKVRNVNENRENAVISVSQSNVTGTLQPHTALWFPSSLSHFVKKVIFVNHC